MEVSLAFVFRTLELDEPICAKKARERLESARLFRAWSCAPRESRLIMLEYARAPFPNSYSFSDSEDGLLQRCRSASSNPIMRVPVIPRTQIAVSGVDWVGAKPVSRMKRERTKEPVRGEVHLPLDEARRPSRRCQLHPDQTSFSRTQSQTRFRPGCVQCDANS